jgi:hypothetical protein
LGQHPFGRTFDSKANIEQFNDELTYFMLPASAPPSTAMPTNEADDLTNDFRKAPEISTESAALANPVPCGQNEWKKLPNA